MFYHIETEERTAGGRTGTVYTLKHTKAGAEAQIWPAHGFNCLRWCIPVDGSLYNLLHVAADWDDNPVPTRSGIPILFPFPNRIRDGTFQSGGKRFKLPLNDSTKKNAIHGEAPRHPWRVCGYSIEKDCAWIHGEFQPSIDAPDCTSHWTGDYRLSVTYRLTERSLNLEARARNLSTQPLPFGLGLHPYLRFPCPDERIDRYKLLFPARSIWECTDNLPTGERQVVPDDLNFNRSRRLAELPLDHLYTNLGAISEESERLLRAQLGHAEFTGALQVWAGPDFREMVLFTPPHRRALCIEPYTCATDAVNLEERGVDAGWKVLPPEGEWKGTVEFEWDPTADV